MTVPRGRAVTTALASVIAVFLWACDSAGDSPKPPAHDDGNEERHLVLSVWVGEKCSPYTINLSASARGLIPEPEMHIAGGGWDHTVNYEPGKRIQFTLKVTAKAGCTAGWCKIDDGRFGDAQDGLDQYGKAACIYTTKG